MSNQKRDAEKELEESRREYLQAELELKFIQAKESINKMNSDQLKRRIERTRMRTIPEDFDWIENLRKWTEQTVRSWNEREIKAKQDASEEAARRMIMMAMNYKEKGNVPSMMEVKDVKVHYTAQPEPESVPDRLYSREYYKLKEINENLHRRLKEEQEKNCKLISRIKDAIEEQPNE